MATIERFEDIEAWQRAREITKRVYRVSSNGSFAKDFALVNQIRRAAVSIPSNIAEGQGRLSRGEFKQFLGHARGSVFELESQILIARNLGYLNLEDAAALIERITEIGKLLNGLLKSLDREFTSN